MPGIKIYEVGISYRGRTYAEGKKIDWMMTDGIISEYPELTWVDDEIFDLKLIPYGCTNLRMTEMPIVK